MYLLYFDAKYLAHVRSISSSAIMFWNPSSKCPCVMDIIIAPFQVRPDQTKTWMGKDEPVEVQDLRDN